MQPPLHRQFAMRIEIAASHHGSKLTSESFTFQFDASRNSGALLCNISVRTRRAQRNPRRLIAFTISLAMGSPSYTAQRTPRALSFSASRIRPPISEPAKRALLSFHCTTRTKRSAEPRFAIAKSVGASSNENRVYCSSKYLHRRDSKSSNKDSRFVVSSTGLEATGIFRISPAPFAVNKPSLHGIC